MPATKKFFTLLLALLILCLSGCSGGSGPRSLTQDLTAHPPDLRPISDRDAAALTGFSLELLREIGGENTLVSPLSVLSALGMTANGAGGETLRQMETVLSLPAEELNEVLAAWTAGLPQDKDCRADLANALWVRDDGHFEANQAFLQIVADWYGAEVYGSKFDESAVREVNAWVEQNTHGMIQGIADEFSDAAMLCLVNALALEAKWETVYREDQVADGRIFTTEDNREQTAALMYSTEGYYLEDETAQGFLKCYKGGRWAFAALLPNEGVTLENYLSSLTGERLYGVLAGAEERAVYAAIPKFQCAYSVKLNNVLKSMGMPDAFEEETADLSGLGVSDTGPLFISQVLHKTWLSVDEQGTKAGAATAVIADAGAAPGGFDPTPQVYLDRPFLYMLVDRETHLPAFIGVLNSLE